MSLRTARSGSGGSSGSRHTLGQPEGTPAGGRHLNHCLLRGWGPAGQEQKCGCFLPGVGCPRGPQHHGRLAWHQGHTQEPSLCPIPGLYTNSSDPGPAQGKSKLGTRESSRGSVRPPQGTENEAPPNWTSAGGRSLSRREPSRGTPGPQLEPAHTRRPASVPGRTSPHQHPEQKSSCKLPAGPMLSPPPPPPPPWP